MNSHEPHGKIEHWTIPNTPWVKRVCYLCDTKRVEDENNFLFKCYTYNHIGSQFQNNCYNANLPNILSH